MLNFYHAEKQEVLQVLHSDQTAGLTEEQAREARSRYRGRPAAGMEKTS